MADDFTSDQPAGERPPPSSNQTEKNQTKPAGTDADSGSAVSGSAVSGPAPSGPAPSGPASADSSLPPVIIPEPDTGYTAAGVPTLEGVREKIETRYGTALGSTELAEDTTAGRAVTERYEDRQKAAADKLEEIRASMREPEHKPD